MSHSIKSTYVIKVKKLTEDAIIPKKVYDTDAGWDLYSIEDVEIQPLESYVVHTGIALDLPLCTFAKIFDRSGNAAKKGFAVFGGVIDNGYTGEIKVIIYNISKNPVKIRKGDRIAQFVLFKRFYSEIHETDVILEKDRNDKGFGSSGD